MKILKLLTTAVMPVLWAALFATVVNIFCTSYGLFETGINYTPLLIAIAGYAWIAFMILTISVLYPADHDIIHYNIGILEAERKPVYYSSNLFTSLNIGHGQLN